MSTSADELIAKLAAEGELEGHGGFSLDPELALAKLREHQLADPTRFVLSWVRAATLLGATGIEVEIDADDVWFRFDGELLEAREFEALWSAVVGFTSRSDARVRALRELALGINGAFAWSAKRVTITAGALQLEFDRSFEMRSSTLDEAIEGTRVHAKRPLAWELLRRRALDARGELPEELLLASACARARVPLVLEGRRLNAPAPDPEGLLYRLHIDEDERVGVLSLRPPPAPGASSKLHLLKAGVAVATLDLGESENWGQGWIEVVLDDSRLPLDLSQDKVVEGARLEALIACVSRARWHAYFALMQLEDVPARAALEAVVVRDIFASSDLRWLDAPGAFEFADAVRLPRAVCDPCAGFRTLTRCDERPTPPRPRPVPAALTLAELVRFARREGHVFRLSRSAADLPFVESLPVVQAKDTAQLRALGQVTLVELGRARYWAAVRELPAPEVWPLPDDWLQLERERDGFRLRLAWRRGATRTQAGALILCRAGRRLAEYLLPSSWGPLWAEIDGPFEFEAQTDGELVPGPSLATAILLALEPYAELIAGLDGALLSELERGLVRAYLFEAWGPWSRRRLDELIVIPEPARRAAVDRWSGGWGVPREWAEARSGERTICDHGLASLRWLDVGGGRLASLRDVQRELATHGQLRYLARELSDQIGPELEAWRLGPHDRALITDLFPGCLEPVDLEAWQREGVAGGFRVPASLDGARFSVSIAGAHGERGLLGLPASRSALPPAWGAAPRRGARLLLARAGHQLAHFDLPLPLGPFYGVIEVPRLRCAPHTQRAVKDEAWRAAAQLVEAAALQLAEAQLEAWREGRSSPGDARQIQDWDLDLERGGWPSFAAAWREWQASGSLSRPRR